MSNKCSFSDLIVADAVDSRYHDHVDCDGTGTQDGMFQGSEAMPGSHVVHDVADIAAAGEQVVRVHHTYRLYDDTFTATN